MTPLDQFRDVDDAIEAGATLQQLYDHTSPLPAERPTIRLGPDLAGNVDACIEAIASDANLFQRNGKLVTVVRERETDQRLDGNSFTAGIARIHALNAHTLRKRLSEVADFEKFRITTGEWRQVEPPKDLADIIINAGEWGTIPPLTGIVATPSLRPDGSIIERPGYDAATGYFYAPIRSFPAMPDVPTRADAGRALMALLTPFADFPVSGAAASRALPTALILTMVGRPAIWGAVPASLFTASTAGSGKSLQSQCASIIGQGRELPVATWSDNPQEVEKVLGAYALSGAPAILFDNVDTEFGCGPLDKVLTCTDTISMRVLGRSEQPELKWRSIVIANGNNVTVRGDTARRTLVQRLEPMLESPEDRDQNSYGIPNLKEWCRENHPRLVVEALTLLRGYILAGRPDMGLKTWGGFEQWTALIANAIVWAGGPNILEARVKESGEEDEQTAALRIVMREWPRLGERGSTAKAAVERLFEKGQLDGTAPPDGFDDLRGAIETLAPPDRAGYRPDYKKLSQAFKLARKRVVGLSYLENLMMRDNRPAMWAVRSVS